MNKLKTTLSALALAAGRDVRIDAFAQNKPPSASPCRPNFGALDRRWQQHRQVLKERGCTAPTCNSRDDIPNQLSQVENMVTKGAKVLVMRRSTAPRCRTCSSRPRPRDHRHRL
jgi:putative multiple sugar transport system substrate-binding protein